MTKAEALVVARIMMTADVGCPYCARDLLSQFHDNFPDSSVTAAIDEAWAEQYASDWRADD
jgi:hypothetical protein